jgi:hypothetical protein
MTDRLRKSLALANQEAQRRRHETVDTHHLLLGLVKLQECAGLRPPKAPRELLDRVRAEIEKHVERGSAAVTGRLPLTEAAERIESRTLALAAEAGYAMAEPEHLLLALLEEEGLHIQVLEAVIGPVDQLRAKLAIHLAPPTSDDHPASEEQKSGVEDGVICEPAYRRARPKVLHLLKLPPGDALSLPALIRDCVEPGRLNGLLLRLAWWSYGLTHDFCPWAQVPPRDQRPGAATALLGSAIVNLNNAEIASGTDDADLGPWAEQNFARWHDAKIGDARPDIVVCGNTLDAAWKAFGSARRRSPEKFRASTGMHFFHDPSMPGCVYLEMPHPSVRCGASVAYTYLMVSAREILPGRMFAQPR